MRYSEYVRLRWAMNNRQHDKQSHCKLRKVTPSARSWQTALPALKEAVDEATASGADARVGQGTITRWLVARPI